MIGSKVFLIPCYFFNELIEGVSDTLLLYIFLDLMIGSKVFLIPCYLFNELIEGVSDTLLLFFFGSYDWI